MNYGLRNQLDEAKFPKITSKTIDGVRQSPDSKHFPRGNFRIPPLQGQSPHAENITQLTHNPNPLSSTIFGPVNCIGRLFHCNTGLNRLPASAATHPPSRNVQSHLQDAKSSLSSEL